MGSVCCVDEANQPALKAHKEIAGFLTPSSLTEIMKGLIYKYLPLTSADLELWDTDPEEFSKSGTDTGMSRFTSQWNIYRMVGANLGPGSGLFITHDVAALYT